VLLHNQFWYFDYILILLHKFLLLQNSLGEEKAPDVEDSGYGKDLSGRCMRLSEITCCWWLASEEFDSKPSGKIVGSTQH